jgi:molybdopterin-guanine dinucleotide biosynthesis protein A
LSRLTALVLAGSRNDRPDPVAVAAGVSRKALAPVAGVPMLSRVLQTLREVPEVGRIVVAAQDAEMLLAAIGSEGDVLPDAGASSPAAAVAAVLERFGPPLLVTTADHPLLTPAMVARFLQDVPRNADAAAAVVHEALFRTRFPEARRTWLRFRDTAVSGCNLFLLATPRAAGVVAFWRRVEGARKQPLRMARLIGPLMLAGYATRLVALRGAVSMLGRRCGARLAAIALPFPEAAVDVDKPDDLRLAESLLATRT